MVRRWGLTWWSALAVLLVAVPMAVHPDLRSDVLGDFAVLFLVSWGPMLVGGLLAWALVRSLGAPDALDRRIAAAMVGHPLGRELAWLAVCLGAFVLSMVVLSLFFGMYEATIGADLAMSASLVSRLLFLFTLPLLVMDRSGVTIDGKGTAMPSLALKVTEGWRWSGLAPVGLALGLIAYLLVPYTGLPPVSFPLVGFVLAFAFVAVCEEIFFRGMVQTRLEILMGRWGGILATSVVFALTYAVIQPYDAVSQLTGVDFVYDTGLSLLTYATAGAFYGYLWACFRNTWLNVLMRIGMFVVIMPPDLQIGIT
ncbi:MULTISPECIES: CPBP family intramembrane glutamic endopeptidase [Nocardiopsidaceae]|uniref:CPBP family intramembrane metalloprotease n=1 Tax=Streptomonospora nanhaiensis TaxID=1323731 RepID=A0ABY6YKF4_9ACTN|nr:CPBP family intramembrane glutamic endopeptidase [Streptomonospora nanhaiensis]WAE72809.1 CPBP family intramembrane metalloprotease [Streptomonospora nanhaiensis]